MCFHYPYYTNIKEVGAVGITRETATHCCDRLHQTSVTPIRKRNFSSTGTVDGREKGKKKRLASREMAWRNEQVATRYSSRRCFSADIILHLVPPAPFTPTIPACSYGCLTLLFNPAPCTSSTEVVSPWAEQGNYREQEHGGRLIRHLASKCAVH